MPLGMAFSATTRMTRINMTGPLQSITGAFTKVGAALAQTENSGAKPTGQAEPETVANEPAPKAPSPIVVYPVAHGTFVAAPRA